MKQYPDTLLHLVDKTGTVHATFRTLGEDPVQSVADMNVTTEAATDGKLRWIIPTAQPQPEIE